MDGRGVIVISFNMPNGRNGLERYQKYLNQIKPIFEGDSTVKVYGAIRESANDILKIVSKEE